MTAELFGLLKVAITSWPLFMLIGMLIYNREIRMILAEVPALARRLLSIKAPGLEISVESEKLQQELPASEETIKAATVPMQLPPPPQSKFRTETTNGNDQRSNL